MMGDLMNTWERSERKSMVKRMRRRRRTTKKWPNIEINQRVEINWKTKTQNSFPSAQHNIGVAIDFFFFYVFRTWSVSLCLVFAVCMFFFFFFFLFVGHQQPTDRWSSLIHVVVELLLCMAWWGMCGELNITFDDDRRRRLEEIKN